MHRDGRDHLGDHKRLMSTVFLRPAISADFAELLAQPLPYRVRAYTALRDDELLGIGGIAFLPQDTFAAFLILKPGARRYRIALHKAGLMTLRVARELGIRRLVATADTAIPAAEPWLDRLGFRCITVRGEHVWVWTDEESHG